MQAEAAAEAADQRLSNLSKELEDKSSSDKEALRRLQTDVAQQQEVLQKVRLLPSSERLLTLCSILDLIEAHNLQGNIQCIS